MWLGSVMLHETEETKTMRMVDCGQVWDLKSHQSGEFCSQTERKSSTTPTANKTARRTKNSPICKKHNVPSDIVFRKPHGRSLADKK